MNSIYDKLLLEMRKSDVMLGVYENFLNSSTHIQHEIRKFTEKMDILEIRNASVLFSTIPERFKPMNVWSYIDSEELVSLKLQKLTIVSFAAAFVFFFFYSLCLKF